MNSKKKPAEYVIRVNGRYFDGLQEVNEISRAQKYNRAAARAVNRVLMCGRGKLIRVSS